MLLGITTVGVALVAGVFFAFSAFVMQGLDRAPGAAATSAMRGINETAVTPAFMLAFLGTTLLCVALIVVSALDVDAGGAKLAIAGGALYLVGAFGTTIAANVPLNDRLERGEVAWAEYVGPWLAFNHVRTAGALAALVLLLLALERA